jgi:hypothetical protein
MGNIKVCILIDRLNIIVEKARQNLGANLTFLVEANLKK